MARCEVLGEQEAEEFKMYYKKLEAQLPNTE
jgi:hypothetical protein